MMKQQIFKYEPNSHKNKKKYEINSLIYTLSFLVIYPLNCYFYKCQSNTQFFQKALFNSFYQTLSFLKMNFFIMHFLKTQLFHYALLQKAKPNSPYFWSLLAFCNLKSSILFLPQCRFGNFGLCVHVPHFAFSDFFF